VPFGLLTAQKKKKKGPPKLDHLLGPPQISFSSQSTHITDKMKRKTEGREPLGGTGQPESKKRALSSEEVAARFRDGLFETTEQQKYTEQYAQSAPYVDI
jgi:hypothetical protein